MKLASAASKRMIEQQKAAQSGSDGVRRNLADQFEQLAETKKPKKPKKGQKVQKIDEEALET